MAKTDDDRQAKRKVNVSSIMKAVTLHKSLPGAAQGFQADSQQEMEPGTIQALFVRFSVVFCFRL